MEVAHKVTNVSGLSLDEVLTVSIYSSSLRFTRFMITRAALSAPRARTREKVKDFVHKSSAEGAHARAQLFLRESQVCRLRFTVIAKFSPPGMSQRGFVERFPLAAPLPE